MTKFQLLLLILMVALAVTACSGGGGQETAVSTETETVATATTQAIDAGVPEETSILAEQEEANSEVQISEPPATEAPLATDTPATANLPVIGPAPGWNNDTWINTDGPLPLEELRGKVVLLEFWTFG